MIPKRVTLKNFLSFGEDEQTLDFTDDESLWVLTGPNGVGKSAVFDAITYCLFGQHRGGKSDAKNLIRHGATGFRVSYEFSFSGADYRITRTRSNSTTQRVERGDASGWQAIAGVNSVAEVAAWVERTLGLRFEAFTASVLLRQGEADAIVEATGSERLALLKRIIDVERFEALANRIGEAAKKCRVQLETLQGHRANMAEVTAEDIEGADREFQSAEEQQKRAHADTLAATRRVDQAKEAEKLRGDLENFDARLAEADERGRFRDHIQTDHDRLMDLQAVVPSLRKIVAATQRLTKATEERKCKDDELTVIRDELAAAMAALDIAREKERTHTEAKRNYESESRRLRDEATREEKFLATAEEAERLTQTLQEFEPDLDASLDVTEMRFQVIEEAFSNALTAKAQAETRLQQTRADLAEFATVGPSCSRCRQPMSEEHAAEERAAFAEAIARYAAQLETAQQQWQVSNDERLAIRANLERMRVAVQRRESLRTHLAMHRKTLDDFGIHVDSQQLRKQLDEKRCSQQEHAKQAEAETQLVSSANADILRLEATRRKLTTRSESLAGELQSLGVALAADRREHETLHDSLSHNWRIRVNTLTEPEVTHLAQELASLETSGVALQFAALQRDSEMQIVWKAQRQEIQSRLADLPTETVLSAEKALVTARSAATEADIHRDAARRKLDELKNAEKAFKLMISEITAAETLYERHRRLHLWLGKDGLLRELVRDAERDIVLYAQETLKNLSGGDLEIELQTPSDGKDEALVLLVRRANDPVTTPVKFLSGSQKFRVAVAIAVAIGKFAAGTSSARPLESVIIDEGFGSLDRDGLNAMREELENLKQSQALKRVILVSHQEEFTSTFQVGYRLTPGENGTRATPFRHGGLQ